MIWLWAAGLLASILLVGLGFAAFWPEYPPIDDTPIPGWMLARTARSRSRWRRTAVLDEELEELPEPPREQSPRTRHRWEHLGQATRRLRPPKPQSGRLPDSEEFNDGTQLLRPPPKWPPDNRIG